MPKDASASICVDNRKIVYSGQIWDVVQESFLFNGEPLVRDFVEHPGAVAVVAVDDQNRILLVNQYRHPVSSYLWELPAGLRDIDGEALVETAKRELLEETGYIAATWNQLTSFFPSPGGLAEEIHVFVAKNLSKVENDYIREGEESTMTARFFPVSEVISSILSGQIKNGPCALAVLAYQTTQKNN